MKKYIIANWKMNPSTVKDAQKLARTVDKEVKKHKVKDMEVVLCPPFAFLSDVGKELSHAVLGAQDCFWEEGGAYTGEVSPVVLKNIGCGYVIVGHSERRIHLGETDEMVQKKIKAALSAGLKVILCIGENLKQRKAGQTKQVIESQLKADLKNIRSKELGASNLFIAYEPIWAISGFGGETASLQDISETTGWIHKYLRKTYGKDGGGVSVIYGGSVKSDIVQEYIWGGGISGFLVGSASLDPQEFLKIMEQCQC